MAVVVEGAAQQIFALQAPKQTTNSPQLLWSQPGRGMGDGSRWLGPMAADLVGDGGHEIIVADQDASGRALLVAYRYNGSKLWQRRFEQTPGAVPLWNVGALTFWWPGCFRAKGQTDLFEIRDATSALATSVGFAEGGQEERGEQRNDRNDKQ